MRRSWVSGVRTYSIKGPRADQRSSTTFYGQIPSGAYQIRARDLRNVDFTP